MKTSTSACSDLTRRKSSALQSGIQRSLADRNWCLRRLLPRSRGLPRYGGGSASAVRLSRPAQTSRYGPLDCSTAQGGLCHEAPAQPVTQPNRSSATGANRQLSGWLLPPLVTRAFGAHSIKLRSATRACRRGNISALKNPGAADGGSGSWSCENVLARAKTGEAWLTRVATIWP
jgi:hypothetical protein